MVEIQIVELLMYGEFQVPSAFSKEAESDCSLQKQSIPQVHGKLAIRKAKACNEMVFEGLDCAFRSIASVISRRA